MDLCSFSLTQGLLVLLHVRQYAGCPHHDADPLAEHRNEPQIVVERDMFQEPP